MQRHFIKDRYCLLQNEKGAIIVMAFFSFLALFALLSLAIDVGNLYRAYLSLQNSADVTTAATVNYIIMKGKLDFIDTVVKNSSAGGPGYTNLFHSLPSDDAAMAAENAGINLFFTDKNRTDHRLMAHNLLRANMVAAGYPEISGTSETTITPTYRVGTDDGPNQPVYDFTIRVSKPIDLTLMPRNIGFIGDIRQVVKAMSTTRRSKLNLALVLDTSDSMNCPQVGTCNCLYPVPNQVRPACPVDPNRRIDNLGTSLSDVLKMLDIDRDNITLTVFNTSAVTKTMIELKKLTLSNPADNPPAATITMLNTIGDKFPDYFPAQRETNYCDALLQAYDTMRSKHTNTSETVNYIFFTDGAPTAGRLLFTNSAVTESLAQNITQFSDNSLIGNYDYSLYTVEWNDISELFYPGPSVLVSTPNLCGRLPCRDGSTTLNPPSTDITQISRGLGCNNGNPDIPTPVDGTNALTAANNVFGICLNSLESHLPLQGGSSKVYGGNYSLAGNTFHRWREQYFNCAIELADFIRSQRGTFYAIGLGQKGASSPTDPYENIDDNFARKDIFLTRFALDNYRMSKTSYPIFPYDGYVNAQTFKNNYGIYVPAVNSKDIRNIFTEIGRRLLLKRVQ